MKYSDRLIHPALLSIISILLIGACRIGKDCPRYFQLPIVLTPAYAEYHVGDTISVVSKFPRNTPALDSEKNPIGSFDMGGIYWWPYTVLHRIDTVQPILTEFSKYFKYLKSSYSSYDLSSSSSDQSWLDGDYTFFNDTFHLEYQFICLKNGTFYLEHNSFLLPNSGGNQEFPGKCNGTSLEVRFEMNNGADNHFDLLNESPDPHWNDWMVKQEMYNKRFTQQGGYCFKVLP